MTTTEHYTDGLASTVLDDETHAMSERARRHLWMHFSNMGSYSPEVEIPIMVRGEGAYVYDSRGKRYLDGLSGLFVVQVGHGRPVGNPDEHAPEEQSREHGS